MSKKYKNPPIQEAFCEFFFEPSQPWDLTVPGLVYEKIKEKFPQKKQVMDFEAEFSPMEGKVRQTVKKTPRMQFWQEDEKAVVQVGQDMLSVNQLRPYPGWNQFNSLILENLQKYRNVTNPKGFKRIGLRYINKIIIDEGQIKLDNYFKLYPNIPDELPQTYDNFIFRVEIPYENGRDRLTLSFGSAESGLQNTLALILDLDYSMGVPAGILFEQIVDWIENAHKAIENVFENGITDKCRELFEKED